MGYYPAIKNKEIIPCRATWMDLEIIILSDVSQRQMSYDITHMWNLLFKKIQMNLSTKQKQTLRY